MHEIIERYPEVSYREYEKKMDKYIYRLKYLKEEEIMFMNNSENKYKIIREIELSIEYIKILGDQLKYYGFVSPIAEKAKKDNERDGKIIKEAITRQKKEYLKTREGYADLKTDNMRKIDIEDVKEEMGL